MKKSTIKRRKRVVPALQEQGSEQPNNHNYPTSVSPDASPSVIEQYVHHDNSEQASFDSSTNLGFRPREPSLDRYHYEPPPIDFTGYHVERRPISEARDANQHFILHDQRLPDHLHPPLTIPPIQSHPPPPTVPTENTRKRSFSMTEGVRNAEPATDSSRPNRLSSISSILNPLQPTSTNPEESSIDPNLAQNSVSNHHSAPSPRDVQPPSSLPPPEYRSRSTIYEDTGGGNDNHERAARKARLKQEAEEMREMLKAKERELEELD